MRDRKKILIIDDETDLCLLLKDYFIRKNCDVSISHTLNEGLNLVNAVHPDVLFLDNNLPDGVGWEYASSIASQFPATYLVLISAFHPSPPAMPVNAQFNVIEKPISFADLDRQFSF
jgi:DNA-binding NtrC family response regulator